MREYEFELKMSASGNIQIVAVISFLCAVVALAVIGALWLCGVLA